jgi:hypothetical protein
MITMRLVESLAPMAAVVGVCVLLLAEVPMDEQWLVVLLTGLSVVMF